MYMKKDCCLGFIRRLVRVRLTLGIFTCKLNPGSLGYEEMDARQYAEWGVDFLKYGEKFWGLLFR
jgi:Alpha galactosidase A